jgi:hypothetical protein
MNYVLIIKNELNGQTEIVNKFFSSVEEAQHYVNENHLVLQKIITEQEYQVMLQNYQNQRLMRRFYQRPQLQQQNQQPQNVMDEEIEEPEPSPQPRPPRPVFNIFKPYYVSPMFVLRRKK